MSTSFGKSYICHRNPTISHVVFEINYKATKASKTNIVIIVFNIKSCFLYPLNHITYAKSFDSVFVKTISNILTSLTGKTITGFTNHFITDYDMLMIGLAV